MRSIVTKLFDRSQLAVPEELTRWHIGPGEVQAKLAELAHSHAKEIQVDVAQNGDSVRLSCSEGTLKGRTVLLYPGLELPFAAEAEHAVAGLCVGDRFTAPINGAPQSLGVEEILRRTPAAVDDALIQAEHIEGVTTLEQYGRWYQEQTQAQNRENARKNIAFFLQDEIRNRSEYALDSEEVDAWAGKRAREAFEECLAMGEDPRIPEEGFELLTDEQAIEKLKEQAIPEFQMLLACRKLCEQEGISTAWENVREEFHQMMPPEADIPKDEREQAKAMYLENAAISKAFELLYKEADRYLED